MEYIRSFISLFDLTVERFVITLLIVAVYLLYKRLVCMTHQYNQLDKLVFAHALIISNKLNVRTIKVHRTSDYEPHNPINNVSED